MDFSTFLNSLIDDGIVAAKEDYGQPNMSDRQQQKLDGSIAGFEACRQVRGSHACQDLRELLDSSKSAAICARDQDKDKYWWYRCYEAEVEWVCNCVSAVLHNEGMPTIITPTMRGVLKAAEIVGVRA